jgi:hypothetical protein
VAVPALAAVALVVVAVVTVVCARHRRRGHQHQQKHRRRDDCLHGVRVRSTFDEGAVQLIGRCALAASLGWGLFAGLYITIYTRSARRRDRKEQDGAELIECWCFVACGETERTCLCCALRTRDV